MKKNYLNYFLILTLIAVSSFPYIKQYEDAIIIVLLILTIPLSFFRKTHIDRSFLLFLSVFIILTYIQLSTFNVFPQRTLFGFFSKLIVAYFVVKIVNRSFIDVYVNLMYYIALISFIFWIPSFISNGLRELITRSAPFMVEGSGFSSYILYQTNMGEYGEWARNCGPFWEPGAFAGFLIIALLFHYLKSQNIKDQKNLVLIGAILSTFSTTGYLALFLFLVFVVIKYRNMLSTVITLIVLIPTFYFAFQELPFLRNKLSDQIESTESKSAYTVHRTRFSSAIIDLQDFKEYPLAGRGKYDETRFDLGVKAVNRNNGTTDLLVMYGIIGFLTYFYYYFISFKNLAFYFHRKNKLIPYFFLLMVLVIGFSENYFLLPFFWSICFLSIPYTMPKRQLNKVIYSSID